jgi:hypothetical protein
MTVWQTGDDVVLEVTSPPEAQPLIQDMFTGQRRHQGVRKRCSRLIVFGALPSEISSLIVGLAITGESEFVGK